jgi:transcriptional regulator with XRE-family HTH domain
MDGYEPFVTRQEATVTQIARHAHIAKAIKDYLEQQQIEPNELARRLGLPRGSTRMYGWLGMTAAPRADIREALARLLGVNEKTLLPKNVPWSSAEREAHVREAARRAAGVSTTSFTTQEMDNIATAALDFYHDKGAPFVNTLQSKPMTTVFKEVAQAQAHGDIVTMSVDSAGMATLRADICLPLDRLMPLFQLLLEEIGRAGTKGTVHGMGMAVTPAS